MIYDDSPSDFQPKFHVVSCFLEHDGKFLLLHRSAHKPQGGKWCAPGGKIDPGESAIEAVIREVREETGIEVDPQRLRHFKQVHVRYPEHDFDYDMFSAKLDFLPDIRLNPDEHVECVWVAPAQALRMDLVDDMEPCVRMFYGI